jgi:hypothetical protein
MNEPRKGSARGGAFWFTRMTAAGASDLQRLRLVSGVLRPYRAEREGQQTADIGVFVELSVNDRYLRILAIVWRSRKDRNPPKRHHRSCFAFGRPRP